MPQSWFLDTFAPPRDNRRMAFPMEVPEGHRSGFVAVVGRPNVGKSTLLNTYLGQPVHAVSSKPQTTQVRQLGILTLDEAQVIFVDTPGIHEPHHKLGEVMDSVATGVIRDADVTLVLFDVGEPPSPDDERVAARVRSVEPTPVVIVALNKIDILPSDDGSERLEQFRALLANADLHLEISATRGDNRQELLQEILARLPEGPPYYPDADITDRYERDIAADFIRAAAMELLHQELPHSIAVRIDEFNERGEEGAHIAATLFVERESQKGIVIGKGGQMIREIGTQARKGIEAMSGRSVYLDLRVKVLPGWRNDPEKLERVGIVGGAP